MKPCQQGPYEKVNLNLDNNSEDLGQELSSTMIEAEGSLELVCSTAA